MKNNKDSKKQKPSPFPMVVRSARQAGDVIHRLRKLKGWSQTELAENSGVTQASVSRIEKGLQKAEISTLIALLAVLDAEITVTERERIGAKDSLEGLF